MFPAADLSLKMVFQNTTKNKNIRFVHHPGKKIGKWIISLLCYPLCPFLKSASSPPRKKKQLGSANCLQFFCWKIVTFKMQRFTCFHARILCNKSVASGDAIQTEFCFQKLAELQIKSNRHQLKYLVIAKMYRRTEYGCFRCMFDTTLQSAVSRFERIEV